MERLRREIGAVVGNTQAPTREQIRKMPYLATVIKESTRPSHSPLAKFADTGQVFVCTHQYP